MSDAIASWFAGRVPDDWYDGGPQITVDREEILVTGALKASPPTGSGAADDDKTEGEIGRIARFREDTREARIRIAREAEARFGRKVAWGARLGQTGEVFTSLAVPVMTRLRQPERVVLDTLVDSGVARSRSHALAWCVRLVADHTDEWLASLRAAMQEVEKVRGQGPTNSAEKTASQ